VIADPDTVVDPGTVVVKSLDAVSADATMSTTASSNRLAVRT